ncbi:MAG: hypothetical protein K2X86_01070, partial [Cytophagaceae bacterium]|nr:hypothetical protein [Cytophagaceae bacterium]
IRNKNEDKLKEVPKDHFQLRLFEPSDPNLERIKEILTLLDINTISPVEALLKLHEIKLLLGEKEELTKKT